MRIRIAARFDLGETCLGDSIAVSGVCLTVIDIEKNRFEVDVSPETHDKTTLKYIRIGDMVNLERALRLSDRLGGHMVSGHVDGIGVIKARQSMANATLITVTVPEELSRYIIKTGSVAVDGISLTVNSCGKDFFTVSIIPHTLKVTTIGQKREGDALNIETDMIGKYVERFVSRVRKGEEEYDLEGSSVDMSLLSKAGFI